MGNCLSAPEPGVGNDKATKHAPPGGPLSAVADDTVLTEVITVPIVYAGLIL